MLHNRSRMYVTRLVRRHGRRCLMSLVSWAVAFSVLTGVWVMPHDVLRGGDGSPNVGFTFSRRQAEYLGMPWRETFDAAMELSPTLVRLGAYWDEIEREPGQYDFSTLDWQLDRLPSRDYRVVLTVGMKAPRWPEYFLPTWLERGVDLPKGARVSDDPRVREHALGFVARVVERYRDRQSIAYWQVENEPLDPSGPRRWRIGADFLAEEVDLVRSLDDRDRPVIVNMFLDTPPLLAALPPWRHHNEERAHTILQVADILGLDLYPSRAFRVMGFDLYLNWSSWGWERPALELRQLARSAGKDTWVIEAQAEPWEPSLLVYTDPLQSRSVRPSTAAMAFKRLQAAGFDTILLWGVEHWYMRLHRHEDATWWDTMSPFFPEVSPGPAPTNVQLPSLPNGPTEPLVSHPPRDPVV